MLYIPLNLSNLCVGGCSHEGSDTPENATDIKVLISSFRPHVLKLKVTKKPDKMHLDLLSEDDQPQPGIWNSITRFVLAVLSEEYLYNF